ncbi:MAG: response regulator, partial [Lachnospiraceae bacterium]|nr:response regulator [Lachnospiraceae bacterium]
PVGSDFLEKTSGPVTDDAGGDFIAKGAEILTVDDTSMNLKLVSLLLKRVGITPDLCGSGAEAVKMCCDKHYDLILLDHMMPGMDGIETLKMIRETEGSQNTDTLAVVLTANAVAGSRDLYIEAGFVDYLTKPIDSALLEQTVKKYLPKEKIIEGRK